MRQEQAPYHIGSRRELFVDRFLIDQMDGMSPAMAQPRDEGIVFRCDKPWEGRYSGYGTVMKVSDGDYRFYYSGCPAYTSDTELERQACVATSSDGVHWQRPDLGLFEVYGTRANNVILDEAPLALNFAPFEDRPTAPASERFKAVGGTRYTGLVMFSSHDGFRWRKMFGGRAVMQGEYLDSKNLVFWSESEGCYVMYARVWRGGWEGHRWIARATSENLEQWSALEAVRILHDDRDVPLEHYYHSGANPYFRAPHIQIALCSQLTERRTLGEDQIGTLDLEKPERAEARSGGGLMSSRGGGVFQRTFMEEFIRPPMGAENWLARCNYPAVGVVRTSPAEMSIYVHVHSGLLASAVRRYTLRPDGFASLRAPFAGGRMVTRPLVFDGRSLSVNYATSSRGFLRIQFETPEGEPIEGFTFGDCEEIAGNEIAEAVHFNGLADVGTLSGRPVRLHITMQDADLYALQFRDGSEQSGDKDTLRT